MSRASAPLTRAKNETYRTGGVVLVVHGMWGMLQVGLTARFEKIAYLPVCNKRRYISSMMVRDCLLVVAAQVPRSGEGYSGNILTAGRGDCLGRWVVGLFDCPLLVARCLSMAHHTDRESIIVLEPC